MSSCFFCLFFCLSHPAYIQTHKSTYRLKVLRSFCTVPYLLASRTKSNIFLPPAICWQCSKAARQSLEYNSTCPDWPRNRNKQQTLSDFLVREEFAQQKQETGFFFLFINFIALGNYFHGCKNKCENVWGRIFDMFGVNEGISLLSHLTYSLAVARYDAVNPYR